MSVVYKNFARSFYDLNHQMVGERMTMTPIGRAYIVNDKPYLGNIHFSNIGESTGYHVQLQNHFREKGELQGRIWGGTAGSINLSYMVNSKAPAAILYDINPLQKIFWDEFFLLVAQCPTSEIFSKMIDFFIDNFCTKLKSIFNLEAMKKEYPCFSCSSPFEKKLVTPSTLTRSSPFRNMSYDDFQKYFKSLLNKSDEYLSPYNKQLNWLANEEHYSHLHMMAAHSAILTVTLDITDTESCNQLRCYLDTADYKKITFEGYDIESSVQKRGALIENLYTSNILFFLNSNFTGPFDFCNRPVSKHDFQKTCENLKKITHKNTQILRFDRLERSDDFFKPIFDFITYDRAIPTTYEPGGLVL